MTNCGSRPSKFLIFAVSIGVHSSVDWPLSVEVCDIIETSAGAWPALAACSSWTSQASPVGSAMDSTAMPVALVNSGKMFLSKLSLK